MRWWKQLKRNREKGKVNNKSMKELFDFDHTPDRRNTRSVKWDEMPDVLPLWVADMDFATAPCVQQAVMKRAQHPCYGYTLVPAEYYQSIVSWFWERHNWRVRAEEILYTIGVIPAIAAILKAECQVGDNVVILSPVYNAFYALVRNAGCSMIDVPLKVKSEKLKVDNEASRNQMTYSIDWEALEAALVQAKTTVLLMSNPHNPVGRVWTEEELLRIGQLCIKHHVLLISDEIHNELTAPGIRYVPMGRVAAEAKQVLSGLRYCVCTSPSKSFNIAGLQNANIITPDTELRRKIDRAININETCDVNPFGVEAVMAAYNEGAAWLDEVCRYIWDNYAFACAYLNKELPALKIADLQATYLMWVDYSALIPSKNSVEVCKCLQDEAKVWLAAGSIYGPATGAHHLRINLATSRALLTEALQRFATWMKANAEQ